MTNKKITKEMSIEDLKILIKKLKNTKVVKLLGGEPTLHSNFKKVVDLLLKEHFQIRLFTNGVFSKNIRDFLVSKGSQIAFTFNIMTPGFSKNAALRKIITNNVLQLSRSASVALSLIVGPNSDINSIIKLVDQNVLDKISAIRVGVSNPIPGTTNTYSHEEFPKIGKKTCALIKYFKNKNSKIKFSFDCGFTQCMFTKKEHRFLISNKIRGFTSGCIFGDALVFFDIQTDLKTFPCYALFEQKQSDLHKESLRATKEKIFLYQYFLQNIYVLKKCRLCRFHQSKTNHCFGPCMAFRKNALNIIGTR